MAVVSDADILALYAEQRSELFPALKRDGSLTPLVVLLAVLPALFAIVNDRIDSADARWGLDSLEWLPEPAAGGSAAVPGPRSISPASQQPLAGVLTALALRFSSLSPPVTLALVSFASSIGVVLVWHAICRQLFGTRFAFWSTLLVACHGSFLAHVQSSTPAMLSVLLAVCALWGLLTHLQDAEGIASVKLLFGGISLGLGLLAGGLPSLGVVLTGLLLAIAFRIDTSQPANGGRVSRSQLRGQWLALKSVAVLALTAFAVGGWWPMMMSEWGGDSWLAWLGFAPAAAAESIRGEHLPQVGAAISRIADLLGILLVPALAGVVCVARGLWRAAEGPRRILPQFLAAWLIAGLVLWRASSGVQPDGQRAADLFLLLPLVGCAALALEEIALRRIPSVVAVLIVGLAFAAPYFGALFGAAPAADAMADAGAGWLAIVGYVLSFAVVVIYLLTTARRLDEQHRLCVTGLLILLAATDAVQGVRSTRLPPEDRQLRQALNSIYFKLKDVEPVDAQLLISDDGAPPDVEFILRTANPGLAVERAQAWSDGIVRATQLIGESKRGVLIVDWRKVDGRAVTPPERNLKIESRFPPTMLHGRRLAAYLLTRRIKPP